jgi:putative pyruvate formate lyase activating enzyme
MDNHIKLPLMDYTAVMNNRHLSKCKVDAMIVAKDSNDTDLLWEEHEHLRKGFRRIYKQHSNLFLQDNAFDAVNNVETTNGTVDKIEFRKSKPSFSYLDLKVKIAEIMFQNCNFCEKACGVDRRFEKGDCAVDVPRIASEFMHVGEESPLVPSHTVFFAGCNFNCVYCQNWDISQFPNRGMALNENDLAFIIEKRRNEGSRNVNFVGGDPTPNLLYILRTMQLVRENIPVVWNSNMYLSEDSMCLLDGFVDLYLTDFKYGNDKCALRLSGVPNYMAVVGRNHQIAWEAGEMIIRHLVLSNHVECCSKPLLKWISQNLGLEVVLNIIGQYHPVYNSQEYEEISRIPLSSEMGEVVKYARHLGFKNLI